MKDPFRLFEDVREAYRRYLDSPFRLRYDALLEERRKLLDRDRQLFRKPLFEPLVPYRSSGSNVEAACRRLGVTQEVAEFMKIGLLDNPDFELHEHQFQAWEESRKGRAVVVTSGTGSGKTECYLIPLFASLIEESARWPAVRTSPDDHWWWRTNSATRSSQRSHEPSARTPAMRALLLYPLNALIEDQLGRIRKAADLPEARRWLDGRRARNRFWFGRYAGKTSVAGLPSDVHKQRQLRADMRVMDREWQDALASVQAGASRSVLQYFQDPGGAEMWSRWDMQEAPPDILITNYSMLNIMLMRAVEQPIFDATREWLASDSRNHFHLIVDELHTYRGTPGTEVGYLLRALFQRLGLTPDSPQLRIIATSASIEGNSKASSDYLEQFFGRDAATFSVIPGHPVRYESRAPRCHADLSGAFRGFARALDDDHPDQAVNDLARSLNVPIQSEAGLTLTGILQSSGLLGSVIEAASRGPFTDAELSEHLFGAADEFGSEAAQGVVRALVHARTERGVAPLPLRAHFFFHNAGRLWACVNPACAGRTGKTPDGTAEPTVGKMFTEPHPHCDSCGARVLELMYCQPCGEVFVGGFTTPDGNNAWHVTPLQAAPRRARVGRVRRVHESEQEALQRVGVAGAA